MFNSGLWVWWSNARPSLPEELIWRNLVLEPKCYQWSLALMCANGRDMVRMKVTPSSPRLLWGWWQTREKETSEEGIFCNIRTVARIWSIQGPELLGERQRGEVELVAEPLILRLALLLTSHGTLAESPALISEMTITCATSQMTACKQSA